MGRSHGADEGGETVRHGKDGKTTLRGVKERWRRTQSGGLKQLRLHFDNHGRLC